MIGTEEVRIRKEISRNGKSIHSINNRADVNFMHNFDFTLEIVVLPSVWTCQTLNNSNGPASSTSKSLLSQTDI